MAMVEQLIVSALVQCSPKKDAEASPHLFGFLQVSRSMGLKFDLLRGIFFCMLGSKGYLFLRAASNLRRKAFSWMKPSASV